MLEEQGGGEGKEGMGQVVQGLVGHGEDLGFDPEDSGSHGDLWAEEGQALTQALKDALWWSLPGGQLVGDRVEPGTRAEGTGWVQVGCVGAGRGETGTGRRSGFGMDAGGRADRTGQTVGVGQEGGSCRDPSSWLGQDGAALGWEGRNRFSWGGGVPAVPT